MGTLLIVTGVLINLIPGAGTLIGSALINAGIAVIIGGVIQLLLTTDPPEAPGSEDESKNYIFNSVANTTAAGGPVPLAYGRCKIGSVVVSVSFETNNTGFGRTNFIYDDMGNMIDSINLSFGTLGRFSK